MQLEEQFQAEKSSLQQQLTDTQQHAATLEGQVSQALSEKEQLHQQLTAAEQQLKTQQQSSLRRQSVNDIPSTADIKQRSRDLNERELQLDQKYQTLVQREKALLGKQHAMEVENVQAREERQRQAEKLMLREERIRSREAQLSQQQQELTEQHFRASNNTSSGNISIAARASPLQRSNSNSQKLVRRTSSGVWPSHDEVSQESELGRSRKRQRLDDDDISHIGLPPQRTPSNTRHSRRGSFILTESDLMKEVLGDRYMFLSRTANSGPIRITRTPTQ